LEPRTDAAEAAAFEQILQHLRETRGFDFTAYRRSSLMRRVRRRMHDAGIVRFAEYLEYVSGHPDECAALFNTILINVTSFFRDPEVWEALARSVLPTLLEARDAAEPIRVWSAGCASGEEPYSAAMLIGEAIGTTALRDRVRIYATDVDEEALDDAQRAVYSAPSIADVPEPYATKYFERTGDGYALCGDLRGVVIFGRHDLIQDDPISRVDLLICRNTLMYFHAEAQARLMSRFSSSVRTGGFVVLGQAEMVFDQTSTMTVIDPKSRIYKIVGSGSQRDGLPLART
jgi:two-component system CheB/CheR fusion protein